jgi:hypothetical protein
MFIDDDHAVDVGVHHFSGQLADGGAGAHRNGVRRHEPADFAFGKFLGGHDLPRTVEGARVSQRLGAGRTSFFFHPGDEVGG